jgi:hypothetical protein
MIKSLKEIMSPFMIRNIYFSRELEEMNGGENKVKWIKGQRISWLGHLERMEEDRMSKKDLHSRTGMDET